MIRTSQGRCLARLDLVRYSIGALPHNRDAINSYFEALALAAPQIL